MAAQGKFWCFTLNNPNGPLNFNEEVEYAVYQKERGEAGTEHYQGYVEFKSNKRLSAVKVWLPTAHFEKRKGTGVQARQYCMKADSRLEGPWEYGTFVETSQGKRNDLKEAITTLKENGLKRVLEEQPEVYVKYHKGLEKLEKFYKPKPEGPTLVLTQWQRALIDVIEAEPDTRAIHWIVDPVGGAGKTTFCKFVIANFDAVLFNGGKKNDILFGYAGQRIVLFNFVRSMEEFVPWEAIESIKDGIYFSSKYESEMRHYKTPIVVCFSNFDPDRSKLSADRWNVIYI
nr:MAG: replication associated protein [Cressdnaviricota sp.]